MGDPNKRRPVEYCEDAQAPPGAEVRFLLPGGQEVCGKSVGRVRHEGFFGLGVRIGDDLQIISSGNIHVLTLPGHYKHKGRG